MVVGIELFGELLGLFALSPIRWSLVCSSNGSLVA